jgi:hypothetical protein
MTTGGCNFTSGGAIGVAEGDSVAPVEADGVGVPPGDVAGVVEPGVDVELPGDAGDVETGVATAVPDAAGVDAGEVAVAPGEVVPVEEPAAPVAMGVLPGDPVAARPAALVTPAPETGVDLDPAGSAPPLPGAGVLPAVEEFVPVP